MPDAAKRILIVDDKECIRTTMSLVLTEMGYQVRSVDDGLAALRAIREDTPEILLSDLNMPGMSGFELLSVVRLRFPAILVIAMSGAFSGNEVPSGIPADAFYQKGSSPTALLQILKAPPRMKRPVSQLYRAPATLSIQRNRNQVSGKTEVAITCPDCLRAFPDEFDSFENLIRQVDCIHCGNSIQYEIFEPTGPMPQQTFRRGDSVPSWAPGLSTLSN
jgi:CheY-like chemotaxis protein